MHKTQVRLVKLIESTDISKFTLREIAKMLGVNHPQTIKYHLKRLEKLGVLVSNRLGKLTTVQKSVLGKDFVSIPVINDIDYDIASFFTVENITGYLRVAKGVLEKRVLDSINSVFVVKATGNFMNRTDILGKNIEEGDYVLIDFKEQNPKDGDRVLSSTEGFSAIRRYLKDETGQKVLITESTQDFPPIYLDESVAHVILGTVLQVIKKPKLNHGATRKDH
ncbi:hypothetical protein COT50_00025 [candidate division WWE3 bacterium CG08_land_8_20_14_0_20_41_10]|uniref:Peptidase S24/S26A/S26B/S26C domain-containing protein n=1 Tax=candidate division WWE3 bacterium CG08_land_8_20_14_0_20_41_10 TaxID=1975085 RepID=A0A2H0XCY2_UNCKA|nr:MAG: hypothetical protein COT50_00025 [candidate division WWE3 bacterium CG08_land_8_20_14_0_20_41_10]